MSVALWFALVVSSGLALLILARIPRGIIANIFDRIRGRNPVDADLSHRRALFARYLAQDLTEKNRAQAWRDDRYADLEVEIEAEGLSTAGRPLTRFLRTRRVLTRERPVLLQVRQ
jgi:hypothetical protein